MIQRIQTIYLLIVFILSIVLFFTPVCLYKNETKNPASIGTSPDIIKYDVGGLKQINNGAEKTLDVLYSVPALTILIGSISFVTILFFKRRKLQLRLCKILIVLSIVLELIMMFITERKVKELTKIETWSTTYLIGIYLPLAMIFLIYLAHAAIKKDDDLVRSSDRLR